MLKVFSFGHCAFCMDDILFGKQLNHEVVDHFLGEKKCDNLGKFVFVELKVLV